MSIRTDESGFIICGISPELLNFRSSWRLLSSCPSCFVRRHGRGYSPVFQAYIPSPSVEAYEKSKHDL
ncbi:hypothetical protein RRG08_009907 [Elysia crispata]|uniref:Uncharacterized protein n=1 Tax=Elysia crispata TaxID=231223 RepID=A0AAE1ARE6_9GAST|nr:hypothetical protein RRG08_009907 [Elysia crispata]